jgi:hypothetical protein
MNLTEPRADLLLIKAGAAALIPTSYVDAAGWAKYD